MTLHGLRAGGSKHSQTPMDYILITETTGSWGRVINEAGVFGVPTVTCSIGSQPEAVGLRWD